MSTLLVLADVVWSWLPDGKVWAWGLLGCAVGGSINHVLVRPIVAAIEANTRAVIAAHEAAIYQTDRVISAMQWNRERSDEVACEYSNRVLHAVNRVGGP
jgi:hypothetical protein